MRMELSHKTQTETATETPVIKCPPSANAKLLPINGAYIVLGEIRFDAFNANKESLTYV